MKRFQLFVFPLKYPVLLTDQGWEAFVGSFDTKVDALLWARFEASGDFYQVVDGATQSLSERGHILSDLNRLVPPEAGYWDRKKGYRRVWVRASPPNGNAWFGWKRARQSCRYIGIKYKQKKRKAA